MGMHTHLITSEDNFAMLIWSNCGSDYFYARSIVASEGMAFAAQFVWSPNLALSVA